MNRIKVQKDTNYTTINNTIIKDKRISLKAKGLFLTVMSLPESWDFSIDGLAVILKEDKTAIYSALDELKRFGYCYFEQIRVKGKFAGNDYTFNEIPYAEKPHTENPDTVKPHTENPPQLNKEVNKVKTEIKKTSNLHPAVEMVRQITKRVPPKDLWNKIAREIGNEPDVEFFTHSYEIWRSVSGNPLNFEKWLFLPNKTKSLPEIYGQNKQTNSQPVFTSQSLADSESHFLAELKRNEVNVNV